MNEEISNNHNLVRTLACNFRYLKSDLKCILNIIDFAHVITVLKVRKDHGKKISKLCSNNLYYESVASRDPEKVLFNFSKIFN